MKKIKIKNRSLLRDYIYYITDVTGWSGIVCVS